MDHRSDERIRQRLADCCAVFSNPNRLKLLEVMRGRGAVSVSELVAETGLSQSAVSQHLKRMRDQGIVSRERCGKRCFYAISDDRIVEAMDDIRAFVTDGTME
ncbi:MAG: ArsR/SmtB family transcription factor [Halodesulfurarchaeum sp.]